MATGAGGLAAFVSTEDSFSRQAQLMRQKLIRPAIERLRVKFQGANVSDVEPQQIGDLFYGTPIRVFGRYASAGSVSVTLSGQVQGGQWKQTVDMYLPETDEGNSEIERMWAQKRVGRLLGSERAGEGSNRDEIVRLCEGYSIVSPYASMLVLENDAEYKRWKIEQRNAVRIQRDRESREVVQQRLAELRRQSADGFELNRGEKLVSTQRKPTAQQTPSPQQASQRGPTSERSPGRGIDLNVGGGGALEPVTVIVALTSVGAAALARRRRRQGM
jgi:hypothetical protein